MGLLSKIGFEASIGDAFKSVVSGKHMKDRVDRDRKYHVQNNAMKLGFIV